jgi:metal transporter CNNM
VIGGDDPIQAKYARAILPIRQNGNVLLCTLLLGNVSVNSLLSILMADMTSGLVGFFSSTLLIVIFGEIVPQAACSRYALFVGYHTLYIVRFFILIFYIMAFPLGWCLDQVLGEDLGESTSFCSFAHVAKYVVICLQEQYCPNQSCARC